LSRCPIDVLHDAVIAASHLHDDLRVALAKQDVIEHR
jgi:hypothetical protein